MMLIRQPFYVLGIENLENAKSSAFGAAGTFFLTFVASAVYMITHTDDTNASLTRSTSVPRMTFLDDRAGYGQVNMQEEEFGFMDSPSRRGGYSDTPSGYSDNTPSGYSDTPDYNPKHKGKYSDNPSRSESMGSMDASFSDIPIDRASGLRTRGKKQEEQQQPIDLLS